MTEMTEKAPMYYTRREILYGYRGQREPLGPLPNHEVWTNLKDDLARMMLGPLAVPMPTWTRETVEWLEAAAAGTADLPVALFSVNTDPQSHAVGTSVVAYVLVIRETVTPVRER